MTLKEKNQAYIILYVTINFSILLVLYKNGFFDSNDFINIFQKFSLKDGVYFVLLAFITIKFQGLFSTETKGRLVFWKEKGYLPGDEAFSKYVNKDSRINKKRLVEKYGNFPRNPKKQNTFWYRIYQELSDERVDKVHKDYLLFRELTSFSILFILSFPFFLYFSININFKILIIYLGILCIQYLVVRYSAKNYGERFVVNVLAIGSSKK